FTLQSKLRYRTIQHTVYFTRSRNKFRNTFIRAHNGRNVNVAYDDVEACQLSQCRDLFAGNTYLLLSFPERGLQCRLAGLRLTAGKAYLSAMNTGILGSFDKREVDFAGLFKKQ